MRLITFPINNLDVGFALSAKRSVFHGFLSALKRLRKTTNKTSASFKKEIPLSLSLSLSGGSFSALVKLITVAIAAFLLIGCGGSGGGDDGENTTNGVYPDCAQEQPKSDGDGAIEDYAGFPVFDSRGVTLSHTIGAMSYKTITDDEVIELKKRLSGYTDYFNLGTNYEKCNVESGMHAKVSVRHPGNEYELELSLSGNGSFVPNAAKFEEVFGKIDSAVSFFYVMRNYDANMKAKLDDYIELAKANNVFSCNKSPSCGADDPDRWFNIYDAKSIDWHIDYLSP
ncbi:MAG: hypothetical protein LBO72_08710 [Helicobacteraceae bacterium]|nr:hypothetical protein [Helicobacteraceae bacterium]